MFRVADTTMQAVELALRGLEMRADAHAHNVANMNTPNFRAGRVDFESALRAALTTGEFSAASVPAVTPSTEAPDPQGNNVNLEDELVGLMKDQLMRDAMVNAYNFKTGVLRTAIQGQPR